MPDALGRRISRFVALLTGVGAVYYAGFGGAFGLADVRDLRGELAVEHARRDSLAAVLDSLRAWGDSLESNPGVIERVAREKLSFIRTGEMLFLFIEEETPDPGAASPEARPRPAGG